MLAARCCCLISLSLPAAQLTKLDTLAGLAVRYNVTVRRRRLRWAALWTAGQ